MSQERVNKCHRAVTKYTVKALHHFSTIVSPCKILIEYTCGFRFTKMLLATLLVCCSRDAAQDKQLEMDGRIDGEMAG